jgi:toxin-antitoxin system PIN domain toxin
VSFAIDANVLLYASDRSSPLASRAGAFLADRAAGSDLFYLPWPTIMGYLRIATHASIFASPLSPDEAMQNIQGLLDLPHVRTLGEDDGFWDLYRGIAATFPMRGNAVPDAHLAALLRQHGVGTLYTNDADFKRFPFLRVVNPFDEKDDAARQ